MKRDAGEAQKARGKFVPPADPLLKGRPRLAEAVADLFWDDGTPREPYTLSVNFSLGQPTIQLNDREEERSLSCTAETVDAGLELLEALLGSASRPWRYWGGRRSKKKG